MTDFVGTKIALFFGDKLVVYQRDDRPGLRFAGMWDFFGGGREDDESVTDCAIREIQEELEIELSPESFVWQKEYPAMHDASLRAYFLVAQLTQENMDEMRFGSEGQQWTLMEVEEFLHHGNVVPDLKGRLNDYLSR